MYRDVFNFWRLHINLNLADIAFSNRNRKDPTRVSRESFLVDNELTRSVVSIDIFRSLLLLFCKSCVPLNPQFFVVRTWHGRVFGTHAGPSPPNKERFYVSPVYSVAKGLLIISIYRLLCSSIKRAVRLLVVCMKLSFRNYRANYK
jgi:hypothetical protein